ncbi:MAG: DUF3667 domain-containing protein [Burkholderiales bacterium]|jgi:hypothetical protein
MSNATRTHCANCDHRLSPWDKFCSQCGQDTLNHPPSLWEFIHEWVLHYLAFEGKLWKSLWTLMARPGFLTLEYLAGRKQRYVLPLRLVLTLGLLFFIAIKLSPALQSEIGAVENQVAQEGMVAVEPGGAAAAASAASGAAVVEDLDTKADARGAIQLPGGWTEQLPKGLREGIERSNARWQQDARAELRRIFSHGLSMAPYAVLVSLPFFAGLLKLLFWRQPYGAHFVFAMHLHAAWYGLLLLSALTPWAWLHFGAWVWGNLYPILALKQVHAAGWWSTLGRGALLAILHWVIISTGLVTLFVMGTVAGG